MKHEIPCVIGLSNVYQLQYCTNLIQTNWIDLGVPGTNGSRSTPVGPDPQRFYRIRLQ